MDIKYILIYYHIVALSYRGEEPMRYLSLSKFTTLVLCIIYFRPKGIFTNFAMYCSILYILQIPLTDSGLFFRVGASVFTLEI